MTAPTPTPKPRGRKASGTALTSAERQRLYRERQKAKLAAAPTIPLRYDKAEARIAELNAENDVLAVKVDRLTRELKASNNANTRLGRRMDELVADLAFLRSRVATWRTEGGDETTAEPARPKSRRKKA